MPRWSDKGVVLSLRPLGEKAVILTCLTEKNGLAKGLVKAGRTKAPLLQGGNILSLTWSARLEKHLGQWTLEPLESIGGCLLSHPLALSGLSAALALIETVLPEREPQEDVFNALEHLLFNLRESALEGKSRFCYRAYAQFEISLLKAAGFRLSLDRCAGTGSTQDLIYVSPRSGGAVSREAGQPYQDKLLPLPAFLINDTIFPEEKDFLASLHLTEYFFDRYILEHTSVGLSSSGSPTAALPAARHRFKDMLTRLR